VRLAETHVNDPLYLEQFHSLAELNELRRCLRRASLPRARTATLFRLENVSSRSAARRQRGAPDGGVVDLGPSGAGKSTLLRLLNRLADPKQGRVHF
jgi:ABC-type polysaccharide/polyol phosphate transport system ATPase subunit